MSAKKNLAVATLLALLAVPAFNGTNVSHTLHMPSVTAHAAEITGDETTDNHSLINTVGMNPNNPQPTNFYGHTFSYKGAQPYIDGKPYVSSQALAYAQQLENGNNTMSNGSESGANSSSSESNGNSQHTSQSGQLPQTNENNGASKAAALGASALVASASLMALSFARKHEYLESVDLASNTDTVSTSKGSDNDTPKYSNKSSYDMIMSNAFNDINKSLKNM